MKHNDSLYHYKRILRLPIAVVVVLAVVLSVLFSLAYSPLYNAQDAMRSLSNSKFSQAGYYNGMSGYNTFYASFGVYAIKCNGASLNATVLMTGENTRYGGNYYAQTNGNDIKDFSLAKDECALSASIAKSAGLRVGDKISVHFNFADYEFTVKYVVDNCYGLTSVSVIQATPLVVLGYCEPLINSAFSVRYLCFSDTASFFTDADILSKDDALQQLQQTFWLFNAALFALCLLTCVIIEWLFSRSVATDLRALAAAGASTRHLIEYVAVDSAYKYLSVYVPSLIIVGIVALCLQQCIWAPFAVLSVGLAFGFVTALVRGCVRILKRLVK